MRIAPAAFLFALAFLPPAQAQGDAESARRGIAAVEETLKQRPDDATLWFFLARFQSQAGNVDGCLAALAKVEALGEGYLPVRPLGFEKAWGDPRFQALRARLEAKLPRLDYAPTEIEVDDRGLLPEGVAYDSRTQTFFMGSTTKKKIIRISHGNAVTDFAGPFPELDSILGLAIDGPRRMLYAVSTSALTAEGRAHRRNSVFVFEVDSARLVRRVEIPEAKQLNDVAVGIGGRVFTSDSASGAIFEIPKEGPAKTLVGPDQIRGSNGLAVSPDAHRLYVAHNTGLAVVDIATGAVKRVANATRESVAAIDGLYEWQGELVGVQNVTTPGRVILISLSRQGDTVTRVRTLLSHHHSALDEPTTGAIGDGGFFFLLAATGVSRYNDKGGIDNPDSIPNPTILRVLLPR
jgi:hypothetical protein